MKGLQKYSFGVLTMVAFLVAGLLGTACTKMQAKATVTTPMTPTTTTSTKKLLALGDSYTIGESVLETERFPNQAIKLLQAKGFDFVYPARIVATTGWTTQNLLDGMVSANVSYQSPWDAVTLLIGVNNQYQRKDTGEYRTQFTQCLSKAIELSGGIKTHVFVVSIPDWGVTPFGSGNNPAEIGKEIDRFNAINKQVTTAMGVTYIDITPISRQNDAALVASDGLHPSGKQYGQWAALLVPVMERGLK